ncbi:MAG: pseudouridine synthase [Verrucomicrobiota bacterium]|nr:pseudouridine synthase [Verrucomicrobiota bacterium]
MVRLQKFLAQAGIASRRASEAVIREGRVEVNGQPVTRQGIQIDPVADVVSVDGQMIQPLRHRYVAVHKPRGVLCTRKDEKQRTILGDLLPSDWDLKPVGRLDRDSEGLIFATNDGDFALRITHPRYEVTKVYQVEAEGRVSHRTLRLLTQGVKHGGQMLRAQKATLLDANRSRSVVELVLIEGKNREIRRMFATQEIKIIRLIRMQIGSVKLGELPTGKWRTLTKTEIETLQRTK